MLGVFCRIKAKVAKSEFDRLTAYYNENLPSGTRTVFHRRYDSFCYILADVQLFHPQHPPPPHTHTHTRTRVRSDWMCVYRCIGLHVSLQYIEQSIARDRPWSGHSVVIPKVGKPSPKVGKQQTTFHVYRPICRPTCMWLWGGSGPRFLHHCSVLCWW